MHKGKCVVNTEYVANYVVNSGQTHQFRFANFAKNDECVCGRPMNDQLHTFERVSLGAYTPGCGAPVATAEDMAQPVTITTATGYSRQVMWQQLNRDRYNAKMKLYMRKRRAT